MVEMIRHCPEWSCTACDAGMLIGFIPFLYAPSGTADLHVSVA